LVDAMRRPSWVSEEPEVRTARRADALAIRALLTASALPIDGAPDDAEAFYVATHAARIVGCAGLELHAGDALLRSVAVAPDFRGRALAARLCGEVERRAREVGARRVFLLTETAEGWFAKRGYRRIERAAAPAGIAASREFAAVCPAGAALMEREL
jgi:N-acetylglutamate synthase-like GNAT family acetyltransferase